MTLWFISDTHFFHHNIIGYQNRPFKNVSEMNEFMVARWNECVKPEDHIYHLGDVTMLRDNQGRGLGILDRCMGHKRLIMGNHDHYHVKHYLKHFEKVMAMNRLDGILFTHVPVHPNSMGSAKANIHGHIHQNQDGRFPPVIWVDKKTQAVTVHPYVNISVEVTGYSPIDFDEVRKRVKDAS